MAGPSREVLETCIGMILGVQLAKLHSYYFPGKRIKFDHEKTWRKFYEDKAGVDWQAEMDFRAGAGKQT